MKQYAPGKARPAAPPVSGPVGDVRPVFARRQADKTVQPLLLEVFNASYRDYGRRA